MSESLRCLVTGGAGFIGSNLVENLVSMGHQVRVIDNLSTGHEHNLEPFKDQIEFVKGDLTDREVCGDVVAGIEIVFHVAALPSVPRSMADPWSSHDNNVNATLNLLLESVQAGVRRIVYSSSSSIYGDTKTLPKVETAEPLPKSPYAAAKLAGEQYVLAFARAGLIEGVALRYFNVFGPRQDPKSAYAAVIPAFFAAAKNNTSAIVHGDGGQTRDFTYIANVVDANLRAATIVGQGVSGTVVNIGAGKRTSLLDLLQLTREVTGSTLPHVHAPPRAGDVRDSLACLKRAEAKIGYRCQVSLEEGLARTWDWFRDNSP